MINEDNANYLQNMLIDDKEINYQLFVFLCVYLAIHLPENTYNNPTNHPIKDS